MNHLDGKHEGNRDHLVGTHQNVCDVLFEITNQFPSHFRNPGFACTCRNRAERAGATIIDLETKLLHLEIPAIMHVEVFDAWRPESIIYRKIDENT